MKNVISATALSFLSLEAKLDILAELGLSASAGTALLEEFDGLSETRFSNLQDCPRTSRLFDLL